jgi:fructose-1,6-bisphosphatase-3
MGASAGNNACICNVLRLCLRYANLATIEEYGINLVPLATFALDTYGDDPCEEFMPKVLADNQQLDEKTCLLTARMHKAITVIQLKEEATVFRRHPEWKMDDRCLFDSIDYERGICRINGKDYEMKSCHFPTIDPASPNTLTAEEKDLMDKLHHSFRISEKLHKHIRTLLSHGCMYTVTNSNLLFHASIPLCDDGSLKEVEIYPGQRYSGKALMHNIGMMIRAAFESGVDKELQVFPRDYARDFFLYLWCGKDSPLFDKSKMATFERYFLKDKETYKEEKGNYFKLRDSAEICDRILDAFEVKGNVRHIINGHVPVHASKGENPIKAGGRLMVIDGGFSEAYHSETGIAGYTLVYHSRGFQLVQHEPFSSARDVIVRETDIKSTTQIVEMSAHRMLVADTDKGEELRTQVADLKKLLYAYRHGILKEKRS